MFFIHFWFFEDFSEYPTLSAWRRKKKTQKFLSHLIISCLVIEGSLNSKLPTIWRVEKQMKSRWKAVVKSQESKVIIPTRKSLGNSFSKYTPPKDPTAWSLEKPLGVVFLDHSCWTPPSSLTAGGAPKMMVALEKVTGPFKDGNCWYLCWISGVYNIREMFTLPTWQPFFWVKCRLRRLSTKSQPEKTNST